MKGKKIRIGSIVTCIKQPELGLGEVWELHPSGRVSVHWHRDQEAWRLRDFHLPDTRGLNKKHYLPSSLRIVEPRKGIIFHGSAPAPEVSSGCILA